MPSWYWWVAFTVWFILGLLTLWLANSGAFGKVRRDLTVGDVLLFMAVGAPFFFILALEALCRVKLTKR